MNLSNTSPSNRRFSNVSIIELLGWNTVCCRGLFCVLYRIYSNISGLYPLDASCENQKCLQDKAEGPPWGKTAPGKESLANARNMEMCWFLYRVLNNTQYAETNSFERKIPLQI